MGRSYPPTWPKMGRRKKKGGAVAARGKVPLSSRKKLKKMLELKRIRSQKAEVLSAEPTEAAASPYTVEDYMTKVDDYMDSFQLDLALQFCEKAYHLEPDSIHVLDTMAPLLLEVGETDRALELFQRAVTIAPNEGAAKFMYLGQLTTGQEAVGHISKGIEVLKKEDVGVACGGQMEEGGKLAELSDAYCALAEIYLTDACFEEDAGDCCYDNCCQAVSLCPSNPGAHQLMASCLLSQQKPEKAKEALMECLALWLPSLRGKGGVHQLEGNAASAGEEEQQELPLYVSRVGTAKLLLELEENDLAFEVLEGLLAEDDEVVGVWYLMGWMHYLIGDADSARFYLEQMQALYAKLGCDEEDMLAHAEDILKEIGPPTLDQVEEEASSSEDETTMDISE